MQKTERMVFLPMKRNSFCGAPQNFLRRFGILLLFVSFALTAAKGELLFGLAPIVVMVKDEKGMPIENATVEVLSIGFEEVRGGDLDPDSPFRPLVDFAEGSKATDKLGSVVVYVPFQGASNKKGVDRFLKGKLNIVKDDYSKVVLQLGKKRQRKPKPGRTFLIEVIEVTLPSITPKGLFPD